MAYIFADGFDLYTESYSAQGQLTTMGPWTNSYRETFIRNVTRFGVGRSLGFRDDCWIRKEFATDSTNTIYISFAMYFNRGLYNNDNFFRFELTDATNYNIVVQFMTSGNIEIYRGPGWWTNTGTKIATFNTAFKGFTWHHFQIKVVIDSVNGSITIRRDGDPNDTLSATGLNTKFSSTVNTRAVLFYVGYVYDTFFMDDLIVNDSSGTTLNTWPGDIRCYSLSPTAAGDTTDFTPTPTQANYLNVNETAPNTTNYNSSNVVGATDLFNIADLASAPSAIYAVVPRCVANKADAGSRSGAIVVKSGTTVSPGTSKILLTTYTGIIQPYTTNPDTDTAWTFSTVNSLQAGYKISS
jgi:hypothetical protein